MERINGKNGKAPQGTGAAAEAENNNSQTVVGENGQLNGKQPEEKPELTVEDKIKKIFVLNDRIETRNLLKTHLEKVDALKFGDYEEKDTITIAGGGKNYLIKSTVLCRKIQTMLREEISFKIAEVEAQISF